MAHAVDGAGLALLGGGDLAGDVAQRALHGFHAGGGGAFDLLRQLLARRLEVARKFLGQLFEPQFGQLTPGLGGLQPLLHVPHGGLQPTDDAGGAGFCLLQALDDARDGAVDDQLRGGRVGLFQPVDLIGQAGQLGAHLAQGLTGAGLGVVEVGGDLAERGLQRAQGLDRAGLGGGLLGAGQAVVGAGLVVLDLLHDAFETGRHLDLIALGVLQARQQAQHGLVDAADGQGGASLGGLDLGIQPVEGLAQALEFLGDEGSRGVRVGFGGEGLGRAHRILDHAVQPIAQSEPLAPGEILGDLPGLGINPLDAPWRCRRTHQNRLRSQKNASGPSLVCKRDVNTRCWRSSHLLWTVRHAPTAGIPLPHAEG